MPKRTKQELAERKAAAAEIAAMYNTVAGGGRMQLNIGKNEPGLTNWIEDDGPTLSCDLSYYRAIPAPKRP